MIIKSTHRAAGQTVATDSDGIEYRVAYSPRERSYYIADNTGECVSGMYDDAASAEADLVKGWF